MGGAAFDMEKFRLMMAQVNRVKEYLQIAPHIPNGVICMESALFVQGFTSKKPEVMQFALPRGARKPRFSEKVPIRYFEFVEKYHQYDRGKIFIDHFRILPVYEIEKSIVDMVRLRSKLEDHEAQWAVWDYVESDMCNLDKLFKCAHDHRILQVVEQMMYNWRRESEVKLRRPRGSFYL